MKWVRDGRTNSLMHFWAYRIAYKTPIGMSPCQLVYEKTCNLPIELEFRAHWAIKKWNMDLHLAGKNHRMQLSKLEEWREKHIITPKSTKKEQRDGMIRESSTKSSNLAIRFYCSIQE